MKTPRSAGGDCETRWVCRQVVTAGPVVRAQERDAWSDRWVMPQPEVQVPGPGRLLGRWRDTAQPPRG